MLVIVYLFLVLMLMVVFIWCINWLMVCFLWCIVCELNDFFQQECFGYQLIFLCLYYDDEIGMLVCSYNCNQQSLVCQYDELFIQLICFLVFELLNKVFLLVMLEQMVVCLQSVVLIVVVCEILQDVVGVFKESQCEMLFLMLVEKLWVVILLQMVLVQVSGYDFVIFVDGFVELWQVVMLSK